MRPRILLAALAATVLAACAHLPSARSPRAEGVDHVLVWSRDGERAAAILTERLGFTLEEPRSYPDGVATRSAWFSDHSYLELFYIADEARAREAAPVEMQFLAMTYGPSNFGLETPDLERAMATAAANGLQAEAPMNDEPGFVTRGFAQGSVPGEPFFIQYREHTPLAGMDRHPNGARRLSAVWVAVEDLAAAGDAYRRVGLTRQRPVALPHLGAKGLVVGAGDSAVLLVQPTGPGPARGALEWPGHRVFGVSVEVADLGRTTEVLRRGHESEPPAYQGPFGRSRLADVRADLGLYIEFHR